VSSLRFGFPSLVEGTNSQLTERTKKMNSENIKNVTNQAIEKLTWRDRVRARAALPAVNVRRCLWVSAAGEGVLRERKTELF
jgi:hypothetical protein